MPRPILDESSIHPAIRDKIAGWNRAIVDEVKAAVQANVFVRGTLVGGYSDLKALIDSGDLKGMLG
jgi:hypothetical protein